jgi:signal transduction histidine kinase
VIPHRLYIKIYLAFIGVALLCFVAAGATNRLLSEGRGEVAPAVIQAAEMLVEGLPEEGPALERGLAERAGRLEVKLALWDADGAQLAGDALPGPEEGAPDAGWIHTLDGWGLRLRLADGRWLSGVIPHNHAASNHTRFLSGLFALFGAMAVGCYPVARGITRRLERLQRGVDKLGAGDLGARVPVQGTDEVAELAARFNAAADRIQALVQSQRRMLASASHELRSPLARLRMALALAEDEDDHTARAALLERAAGDVAELDALIEDLLLSSRLEAAGPEREPVELLALLAGEGARVGADVSGAEVSGATATVQGDRLALTRALRNLLENARRHGAGAQIEAWVELEGGLVRAVVADRGPGVAPGEAERIFEPFYRPDGHREGADGGVGLGLALVRQIAERHGGTARYRPREGGGSRFELELPATPGGAGL